MTLYGGKVFPNFCIMFQEAITLPVNITTCEILFSTM